MYKINKVLFPLISVLCITATEAEELGKISDLSSIINSFMNEDSKLKEKINTAGKQRMLTQEMTKLVLLIDLDIKEKRNINKLTKASKQYGENLNTLQSDNEQITEQLQIIKKLWNPFQSNIEKMIHKKEQKEAVNYIISHNDKLLTVSNKLVNIYEKSDSSMNYLDKAKLYTVNLAGRQRMLLEKMSKEKILSHGDQKEYIDKLKSSIDDFDLALEKLKNGDSKDKIQRVTNPKLIRKLDVIEKIWKELKPLYLKETLSKNEFSKLIHQSSLLRLESNIYVKLIELESEY